MFIKNKKAYHDYTILREIECGIVLKGSEVKSVRGGHAQLKGSWGYISNNEVYLKGMHISKWGGSDFNHEEVYDRKLLLRKSEIFKLHRIMQLQKGLTLVPLSLYMKNGKVKCLLGLCQGKKKYDKRHDLKERSISIDSKRGRYD